MESQITIDDLLFAYALFIFSSFTPFLSRNPLHVNPFYNLRAFLYTIK